MGRNDTHEISHKTVYTDEKILAKFYKRFPALKATPNVFTYYNKTGSDTRYQGHPIFDYVQKYKKLKAKGYSEYKAFSIVETELSELLDSQLNETRILRGAALAAHGDSYLDRAQRVAELESEMKLMRFVRDMPKHERASANFLEKLQGEVDEAAGMTDEEGEETRRDRVEDLFAMNNYDALTDAVDYEPVMYKLLNEIERRHQPDESLVEI